MCLVQLMTNTAVYESTHASAVKHELFNSAMLNIKCNVYLIQTATLASSIIGGGAYSYTVFVFTDLKNNRFQNKLIMQNTNT